jgi:hypothetical protein
LEATKLKDRSGQYNPHFSGMVSRETGKHINLEDRDMGQMFPFLMKESLRATSDLVYPNDAAAHLALDTIGQMMAKIYNDSIDNNLAGMCQFRELYKTVAEIPVGPEAYANWSTFFVQTFFCYMFTVSKVANGLPREICKDVAEYQAMVTCLSALDDDLKKKVMDQWRDRGVWPSNMSYGKLIRRLDDYVEVIKEGQRLRIEHETKLYRQRNAARELVTAELMQKIADQTGLEFSILADKFCELPKWMLEEIRDGNMEFKNLAESGKTADEFFTYIEVRAKEGDAHV